MKKRLFPWNSIHVLVTGGASFIGSTLVDQLITRGAQIRVVDDLSSGKLENIKQHIQTKRIEFINKDLREPGVARKVVQGINLVFHLAADHGGRGYVELHQAGPASNLFLDGLVLWEALKAKVDKIIFASSGCVYPNYLQKDPNKILYLKEEQVKPPYDADNMYGWAKLMTELSLAAYYKEYGLKSVSLRYFTVYGPKCLENHAIMAMIARSFLKQDPFEVWGDGSQVRNWTFIDDIVAGTISAAEKIDNGITINLGTTERILVKDAVQIITEEFNYKPMIKYLKNLPVGP